MISVPGYLVVGQAALLALACFVLASAYRRLGKPADPSHHHDLDEAVKLVGSALPDLGPVLAADGSAGPPPREPGAGAPVLLVYVLPGCETCQAALGRLQALVRKSGRPPVIHLLTVGADSSVDAYRRFDLPIWRSQRDLADIFGLTAYPVFLAVDETGMIKAAGSTHDPDALRSYLAVGSDGAPTSGAAQHITITPKP